MTQVTDTGTGTGVLKFTQRAYSKGNIVKPTEDGRDAFLTPKANTQPGIMNQETFKEQAGNTKITLDKKTYEELKDEDWRDNGRSIAGKNN